MQAEPITFKAVICKNGFVFKDTILSHSQDKASDIAAKKIKRLNKAVISKKFTEVASGVVDTFTLVRIEPAKGDKEETK